MAFDSGDTAWMLTATLLVMMMMLPGLALFYGGPLPAIGGHGGADYSLGAQLLHQSGAVLLAISWSAVGSAACFSLVQLAIPLRRDGDEEREGLDLSDHGERVYNPKLDSVEQKKPAKKAG